METLGAKPVASAAGLENKANTGTSAASAAKNGAAASNKGDSPEESLLLPLASQLFSDGCKEPREESKTFEKHIVFPDIYQGFTLEIQDRLIRDLTTMFAREQGVQIGVKEKVRENQDDRKNKRIRFRCRNTKCRFRFQVNFDDQTKLWYIPQGTGNFNHSSLSCFNNPKDGGRKKRDNIKRKPKKDKKLKDPILGKPALLQQKRSEGKKLAAGPSEENRTIDQEIKQVLNAVGVTTPANEAAVLLRAAADSLEQQDKAGRYGGDGNPASIAAVLRAASKPPTAEELQMQASLQASGEDRPSDFIRNQLIQHRQNMLQAQQQDSKPQASSVLDQLVLGRSPPTSAETPLYGSSSSRLAAAMAGVQNAAKAQQQKQQELAAAELAVARSQQALQQYQAQRGTFTPGQLAAALSQQPTTPQPSTGQLNSSTLAFLRQAAAPTTVPALAGAGNTAAAPAVGPSRLSGVMQQLLLQRQEQEKRDRDRMMVSLQLNAALSQSGAARTTTSTPGIPQASQQLLDMYRRQQAMQHLKAEGSSLDEKRSASMMSSTTSAAAAAAPSQDAADRSSRPMKKRRTDDDKTAAEEAALAALVAFQKKQGQAKRH